MSWNLIETLHKQISNIGVILQEFLKITVSQGPGQSEMERMGKLKYIT
jgi:hypothetical protein